MNNKELAHLLDGIISPRELQTLIDIDISNIELDSRLITTNGLFVALKGAQTDGRLYIEKAIKLGAVAILVDPNDGELLVNQYAVPVIYIENLNEHLSEIASRFYDFPQRRLTLIGVTGTNGKTTVNQLIGQWLTLLGHKTYCMGTLGNGLYGDLAYSPNTTLNAIDLIAHLHRARCLGAAYVVMEVSSHGLALNRVEALHFDVAAFTNLTQDHLDLHGTMQAYSDAKQLLFTPRYSTNMVLNGADKTAQSWLETWAKEQRIVDLTCFNAPSELATKNIIAKNVSYSTQGITASVAVNEHQFNFHSKLLGTFNLDNLLTAFSCLVSAGFNEEQLLFYVSSLEPVIGRMEVFGHAKSPSVVVDYAHTPDALKQALQALRQHCNGKLWVVFGCGGDRDAKKRPLMASVAEEYADSVIFTQDNSRSESPSLIFSQMLEGIKEPNNIIIEHERSFAVKQAINSADVNDIVLLAGKGHENYQILQCGRIDYDERALARATIENLL